MASPCLIVRLHNWIGDVVVGLPALQLLAQHGVPLQLVGKGWTQSLLAGHCWPVHRLPAGLRPRVALWRGLRAQRADSPPDGIDALLLATSFSAALECRLAGVRAAGYATDHRRWLLAQPVPVPVPALTGHALLDPWQLACRHLGLSLAPPADIGLRLAPAAMAQAEALRAGLGLTGDYALLCPGPGEEAAARRDFPQALSLPGVPLGTYAALLQGARLVVANDTGPGHMAAAVGAPLLSVLGPTDAARWAPWGHQVQVAQASAAAGGWPSGADVLRQARAIWDSAGSRA